MKTLIRNALVVLPTEVVRTSLVIEGSKIADLDPADQVHVDHVVDASGLYLLPGVIDDQVHFREPGATHKEDIASGSRACAQGGITTYLEMPNTNPPTTTRERLLEKLQRAARTSSVNYGFFIGATVDNLEELRTATRCPGIKIFIGSSTGDLLVDDQQALERIFAKTQLPIAAHCEDEATVRANRQRYQDSHHVADHSNIRDHQAAVIATRRAMDLAKRHRHRLHVLHVSTAQEVELLRGHENVVTAEACPHHLLLNVHDYARLGSLVQMNPSLKNPEDNTALWQGLLEGTIQVIATDHAPHTWAEKMRPYPESPSGIPCVENSLALMLDQVANGRCTLPQVVQWMCEAPARVWDIVGKGRIEVGFDADLVLVDMQREKTVLHHRQWTRCGWTPWHGRRLRGWPVATWVMGQLVYRDGVLNEQVRGAEATYDHQRGGYWGQAGASLS